MNKKILTIIILLLISNNISSDDYILVKTDPGHKKKYKIPLFSETEKIQYKSGIMGHYISCDETMLFAGVNKLYRRKEGNNITKESSFLEGVIVYDNRYPLTIHEGTHSYVASNPETIGNIHIAGVNVNNGELTVGDLYAAMKSSGMFDSSTNKKISIKFEIDPSTEYAIKYTSTYLETDSDMYYSGYIGSGTEKLPLNLVNGLIVFNKENPKIYIRSYTFNSKNKETIYPDPEPDGNYTMSKNNGEFKYSKRPFYHIVDLAAPTAYSEVENNNSKKVTLKASNISDGAGIGVKECYWLLGDEITPQAANKWEFSFDNIRPPESFSVDVTNEKIKTAKFVVVDHMGKTSEPKPHTHTIIFDTTPPIFNNLSIPGKTFSQVVLSATPVDNDGGSGIKESYWIIDNMVQGKKSGEGENTIPLSKAGTYYVKFYAIDNAGNPRTSDEYTVTYINDTTKPTIPAPSFTGYEKVGNKLNAVFSWVAGTDEGGSGLQSSKIFIDGVEISSTPGEVRIPFENTSKTYELLTKARDNAGNNSDDKKSTLNFSFPKELSFDNSVSIPSEIKPSVNNGKLSYSIKLPFTYGLETDFDGIFSSNENRGISYNLKVKIGDTIEEEKTINQDNLVFIGNNKDTKYYTYTFTPGQGVFVPGQVANFYIETIYKDSNDETLTLYTGELTGRNIKKLGSYPVISTSDKISPTKNVPRVNLTDNYASDGVTLDGLGVKYKLHYKRPGDSTYTASTGYITPGEISLIDTDGNPILTHSGEYSIKVKSEYADGNDCTKNSDNNVLDITYDISSPKKPKLTVTDDNKLTNNSINFIISGIEDNGAAGVQKVEYWYDIPGGESSTPVEVLAANITDPLQVTGFTFPKVGNNESKTVTLNVKVYDNLDQGSEISSDHIEVDKEKPVVTEPRYTPTENSITFKWDCGDQQKLHVYDNGGFKLLNRVDQNYPFNGLSNNQRATLRFKVQDEAGNISDEYSIEGCSLDVRDDMSDSNLSKSYRNNKRYIDLKFTTTINKYIRYIVTVDSSNTELTGVFNNSDNTVTFSYPYTTKRLHYFYVNIKNDLSDINTAQEKELKHNPTNYVPVFNSGTFKPENNSYLASNGSLEWPTAKDNDSDDVLLKYIVKIKPEGGTEIIYNPDTPLIDNYITLADVLKNNVVDNKSYDWYVVASDGIGESFPTNSRSFIADCIGPIIAKNDTKTDIYTNSLSFNITDGGSGVESVSFKVNGEDFTKYTKAGNDYTFNFDGFESGTYDIDVIAVDNVGNPATENNTLNIAYDKNKPQIDANTIKPTLVSKGAEYISPLNKVSVKLEAFDDYSGIKELEYSFSTNSNATNHSWEKAKDDGWFKNTRNNSKLGTIKVEYKGNNGDSNYLFVRAIDNSGRESDPEKLETPIYFDTTYPFYKSDSISGFIVYDNENYLKSLDSLIISAKFEDTEEVLNINSYKYSLINGDQEVLLKDYGKSTYEEDVSLTPGVMYSVEVMARNKSGLEKSKNIGSFIFDNATPTNPSITFDDDFYVKGEGMEITLSVDHPGSGVTSSEVFIGTEEGKFDLLSKSIDSGWKVEGTKYSKKVGYTFPSNRGFGKYYVKATFKDALGNETTINETFEVRDETKLRVKVAPYTGVQSNNRAKWYFNKPDEIVSAKYKVTGDSGWTTMDDLNPENLITFNNLLEHGEKVYVDMVVTTNSKVYEARSNPIVYDNSMPKDSLSNEDSWPKYIKPQTFEIKWQIDDLESGISKIRHRVEILENDSWEQLLDWTGELQINKNGNKAFTNLKLIHGNKIRIKREITNGVDLTIERTSPAIIVDGTIPEGLTNIIPNSFYLKTSATPVISWATTETDNESGMKYYWVFQKELKHKDEIENWNDVDPESKKVILDVNPSNKEVWYFILKGVNGAGESTSGFIPITFDDDAPYILNMTLGSSNNASHINYLTDGKLEGLTLYVNGEDLSGSKLKYEVDYGYYNEGNKYELISDKGVLSDQSGVFSISTQHKNVIKNSDKVVIFRAFVTDEAGNISKDNKAGKSLGTIYTGSPAILEDSIRAEVLNSILNATWTGVANRAPIKKYHLKLKKGSASVDLGDNSVVTDPQLNLDVSSLNGTYTLFVRAECEAGLISVEETAEIVIDNKVPEITILKPIKEKYVYKNLKADYEIDENNSITGYKYKIGTKANDKYFTGDVKEVPERLAMSGSFDFDLSKYTAEYNNLNDGTILYLYLSVKDYGGNWSHWKESESFILDSTPASNVKITVPVYSKEDNKVIDLNITGEDGTSSLTDMELTLYKLEGDEEVEVVTISKPLNGNIGSDDKFDFDDDKIVISLLDDTKYRIGLKIANGTGVYSPEVISNEFIVDLTNPEIVFPEEEIVVNYNNDKVIKYSLSEDAELKLYLYKGEDLRETIVSENKVKGDYTYTFDHKYTPNENPLAYGVYTLKAILKDKAGNVSTYTNSASNRKSIRFNEPPIIDFGPLVFKTNPGKPYGIAVDVTDNDGKDSDITYSWTFNRGNIPKTDNYVILDKTKDPTVRFYHSTELSQETTHSITLTATDKDKKSTTVSHNVVVKNTEEGQLYINEFWSGSHTIIGDILVPTGTSLTVDGNSTVDVNGNYEISVYGVLTVKPNSIFTTKSAYNGLWKGIVIEDDGSGNFTGSIISKAERGLSVLDDGVLTVNNSTLDSNIIGLHLYNNTKSSFTNSIISNSLEYGIKEDEDSNITISPPDIWSINNSVKYYDSVNTINIGENE